MSLSTRQIFRQLYKSKKKVYPYFILWILPSIKQHIYISINRKIAIATRRNYYKRLIRWCYAQYKKNYIILLKLRPGFKKDHRHMLEKIFQNIKT